MALVSLPALFVFVVAQATRSSAGYNISCAMDVHGNCDREYSLIRESNGIHTWTDEDLSIYCREIADNVDCKQEYLEKCSNETAKKFFDMTRDLRDLAQEICNETSDLRAAFRLHNACIRNASDEYGGCWESSFVQSILEVPRNRSITTTTEEVVKFICRMQEVFTECFTGAMEKSCGLDAADFVSIILNRPFTRLRTPFCVEGRWNDYIDRRANESSKREAVIKNRYLVAAGVMNPMYRWESG